MAADTKERREGILQTHGTSVLMSAITPELPVILESTSDRATQPPAIPLPPFPRGLYGESMMSEDELVFLTQPTTTSASGIETSRAVPLKDFDLKQHLQRERLKRFGQSVMATVSRLLPW